MSDKAEASKKALFGFQAIRIQSLTIFEDIFFAIYCQLKNAKIRQKSSFKAYLEYMAPDLKKRAPAVLCGVKVESFGEIKRILIIYKIHVII
jgi:hypothetical protein